MFHANGKYYLMQIPDIAIRGPAQPLKFLGRLASNIFGIILLNRTQYAVMTPNKCPEAVQYILAAYLQAIPPVLLHYEFRNSAMDCSISIC